MGLLTQHQQCSPQDVPTPPALNYEDVSLTEALQAIFSTPSTAELLTPLNVFCIYTYPQLMVSGLRHRIFQCVLRDWLLQIFMIMF